MPRQLNDHLGDEHTGCRVVRLNDLQRIDDTDVAVTVYVVHDIRQVSQRDGVVGNVDHVSSTGLYAPSLYLAGRLVEQVRAVGLVKANNAVNITSGAGQNEFVRTAIVERKIGQVGYDRCRGGAGSGESGRRQDRQTGSQGCRLNRRSTASGYGR